MKNAFMNRMIVTVEKKATAIWFFIRSVRAYFQFLILHYRLILRLKRQKIARAITRFMWNRVVAPLYIRYSAPIIQAIEEGDASITDYHLFYESVDSVDFRDDQYAYDHSER